MKPLKSNMLNARGTGINCPATQATSPNQTQH